MKAYEYIAREAESDSALTDWTFESYRTCETRVLPDGCRDIIVQESDANGSSWFISELCKSAYCVPSSAGTRMRGLRLRPGVRVLEPELSSWMNGRHSSELFNSDQLSEFCVQSQNMADALECLASSRQTVQDVAKQLGVSLRTLERLIKSETGQPPYYWFSLARIRRAGRFIVGCENLNDAAYEMGFSDQAHMNREVKKWFRLTPNQMRGDNEMQDLIFENGYG